MACLVDLKVKVLQDDDTSKDDNDVLLSPVDEGDSTEDEWSRPPAIQRLNSAPGGSLAGLMRGLVSQQKTRFKDGEVDLDLSYITPRIIAMGFPSCGTESYYRNPMDQVEAFLESRHSSYCRVYNLCSERKYDSRKRFSGNWAVFPFDDHHPPMPFSLIQSFINDASAYLRKNEKNIIAVHCKAGKSRTGVMICCLLLSHFPGMCPTADMAIDLFARKRTTDNVAVNIPSQIRYIKYFEQTLSTPTKSTRNVRIHSIKLVNPPPGVASFKIRTPRGVGRGTEVTFSSRRHWKTPLQVDPSTNSLLWDLTGRSSYGFDDRGVVVQGDVKIVFKAAKKLGSEAELFRCCFNTMFHDSFNEEGLVQISLSKNELDKACKDTSHKKFSADMRLIITLATVQARRDRKTAVQEKVQFRDTDGDSILVMSGGAGSHSLLYSVNAEMRDPVKVVLLDQTNPDYVLFPEIDKGIHLPGPDRRRILKQLYNLCEASMCEHNIPDLDVVGVSYDKQQCCNAPLPCSIPDLRVHFDARKMFKFTIPAVDVTTVAAPAILSNCSVSIGDISIHGEPKQLKQYAVSVNKCCDKVCHLATVTVRDMSNTFCCSKEGLMPTSFTVATLDNLVWELRTESSDSIVTAVSSSGTGSVQLSCCGQCELIFTQLNDVSDIHSMLSNIKITPFSWDNTPEVCNEITAAWKPFIGVDCTWVDAKVQTLSNLLSTHLRARSQHSSVSVIFALSATLSSELLELLLSYDPLSSSGVFVFGRIEDASIRVPNGILISDCVSTAVLNNIAILLCERCSGADIEFCS